MKIYVANQETATLTRPFEDQPLYIIVNCSTLYYKRKANKKPDFCSTFLI